jgi:hypothetical protein
MLKYGNRNLGNIPKGMSSFQYEEFRQKKDIWLTFKEGIDRK